MSGLTVTTLVVMTSLARIAQSSSKPVNPWNSFAYLSSTPAYRSLRQIKFDRRGLGHNASVLVLDASSEEVWAAIHFGRDHQAVSTHVDLDQCRSSCLRPSYLADRPSNPYQPVGDRPKSECADIPSNTPGDEMMINGIVDGTGSMMWGMGWSGLLILVLVVLGVAALGKYLFFNDRRKKGEDVLLSRQNVPRRFR
jgi:hypothetical protein